MTATWQQELKQALRNDHPTGLINQPGYDPAAAGLFAPVITDTLLQAIKQATDPAPLWRQFLPIQAEQKNPAGYVPDPVGDAAATQVPGLIHKYHGRVLLIASGSCAVNCRYCFRRHFPYRQSYAPRNQWQASIDYIQADDSIHEVILSGGDPLTLSTKQLAGLTAQLATIDHVKTLRIHSRMPVVLPARIDDEFHTWAESLSCHKVMVLHVNHPSELSPAARTAIARLRKLGFVLLNQSVMLHGINDQASTLAQLSHQLFEQGVLPYYLHQFDPVQNAAHFAVSPARTRAIHQQLMQQLPGYLVPKLVQEVAGEPHKTPL
ncbi:EF-P beta-lysylation protein EpmB [Marinicella meishanensis]|uniref:EF-P beta-lysylation protein EpmB n=1 Tax=Marinicella meishanensis TaxID=2873263 RepID=UPI001CBAFFD1|nr:EF-P beta-lysylation protein EpmB [Marinicella sp. NBU2979]